MSCPPFYFCGFSRGKLFLKRQCNGIFPVRKPATLVYTGFYGICNGKMKRARIFLILTNRTRKNIPDGNHWLPVMAGRESIPEAVVFGVESARIDWGADLSPEIQKMIPSVIEAIKVEIAGQ
jgi:hypothetical protein